MKEIKMQYQSRYFHVERIITDIDNAIKVVNDNYFKDHADMPGMTLKRMTRYFNIFNSRFIDKKSINEIANEYNLTSARVYVIINKIISYLIFKHHCK
jgi:hypothetical protein